MSRVARYGTAVAREGCGEHASIERIRGSDDVAVAMELVSAWEMVELELLGGKGPPAQAQVRMSRARGA